MRAQRVQRGGQCVHGDRRPAGAAARHAVGQQADRQHMVQVRMAEEDAVDARQFVQRQVADAGAGVDEHVVVHQEGRGAIAGGNRSRTAEYTDLHEEGVCGDPRPLCSDGGAGRARASQDNVRMCGAGALGRSTAPGRVTSATRAGRAATAG